MSIPANERPSWAQPDFEPLGGSDPKKAPAPDPQSGGWQNAPQGAQQGGRFVNVSGLNTQQPGTSRRKDWGGGWWFWMIVAFFIFGGWRVFEGDTISWWWLLFLWWPLSSLAMNVFNVERRVVFGVALILVALSFLMPGSLSMGMLIGVGLVLFGIAAIARGNQSS